MNVTLEMISVCGVLSKAAYGKHGTIPATTLLRYFRDSLVSFSIFQSRGWKVLAITGTDELGDWGYNVEASMTETPLGIRVHSGFLRYARIIAEAMKESPVNPGERWLVTGHSLGGAAATMLPLITNLVPEAVVTFGAPKSIHAEDETLYPCNVINIRNQDDIVPWVPLARYSKPWGVPGKVYYLTGSAISVFPGSPLRRFAKQAYSAFTYFAHRGNFLGVHEHSMDRYLENISRIDPV